MSKQITVRLDRCARCKKVIPKNEPYAATDVYSGPCKGERIPAKGFLCEPCMADEITAMVAEAPAVYLCNVYH
jgi:hypothetical protein